MKIGKVAPNLVFIKVDEPKTHDEHGIPIIEEWKELPPTGTVVGRGDGITTCEMGERVFFERFSSIPTPFGSDIRAVRESAILSTIEVE